MSEQGKSKKHGHKKNICATYRTNQRAEFNKARRLKKYLKKWPFQHDAWEALEKLGGVLYMNHKRQLGLTEFLKFKPARPPKEAKA